MLDVLGYLITVIFIIWAVNEPSVENLSWAVLFIVLDILSYFGAFK